MAPRLDEGVCGYVSFSPCLEARFRLQVIMPKSPDTWEKVEAEEEPQKVDAQAQKLKKTINKHKTRDMKEARAEKAMMRDDW